MIRVFVNIDKLVLKGIGQESHQRIAEGLRGELGRLLGNPTTAERLAYLRNEPRISLGSIHLAQDARPESFGASMASKIARRLSR
jgi:hypothetical protein